MKVEERKTHLMALLSFVITALMLVIVSPTYVQADNLRILDGDRAKKWLASIGYISCDQYNICVTKQRKFGKFDALLSGYSPDGLRAVDYYTNKPWGDHPKSIENPVILVDWQVYQDYRRKKRPDPFPDPFLPNHEREPERERCKGHTIYCRWNNSGIGAYHIQIKRKAAIDNNRDKICDICGYSTKGIRFISKSGWCKIKNWDPN